MSEHFLALPHDVNRDVPLPPPVNCKVCGYSYYIQGVGFDGEPVDNSCPQCRTAIKSAEDNSKKLALQSKHKDVTSPATFAQMEELIALQRRLIEQAEATRASVRGIQWAIFGFSLLTIAASLVR